MTPEQFVAQWQDASGSERANYQSFFNDLCELLEVERPRPAQADDRDNAYVHERHLKSADGRSQGANRYIDTYKRGCFIAEGKAFYDAAASADAHTKINAARDQAESYARNLPEGEPLPPLLMVINTGRYLALYANFKD